MAWFKFLHFVPKSLHTASECVRIHPFQTGKSELASPPSFPNRLLKKQFFHRALKVMKKKPEKDTKKEEKKEKEKDKTKGDSSREEEKKGKKEKKKEPEAAETKKEKSVHDPSLLCLIKLP